MPKVSDHRFVEVEWFFADIEEYEWYYLSLGIYSLTAVYSR
jgi:hypothetical protein